MRRTAWPALAATVIALAGCGSPPLSVSQLRGSATRICQLASRQGDQIPYPSSPGATAAFLRSSVPVLRDQLANLKALTPPSSMESTYASSVAALSQQLQLIRQTVQRLDAGADPLSAIRVLQQRLSAIEAQGDAAWRKLGIPACATS